MEEKYDFVEEVIRKKPSRLRLFLKKCLALVGAALFLSAGVLVILFVFRDNLILILRVMLCCSKKSLIKRSL